MISQRLRPTREVVIVDDDRNDRFTNNACDAPPPSLSLSLSLSVSLSLSRRFSI